MEQNIEYEPSVRYEADITQGLSQEQVRQRTEDGWTNEAVTASSKTVGQIIKSNLYTYYNLIFTILAILIIAAGSLRNLTFLPVVLANLLIGIIQELRAKKILDELTMQRPQGRGGSGWYSFRSPGGDAGSG